MSYDLAIGIRADEVDRVSATRHEKRIVYPLVEWGTTKDDVRRECASWPFDLGLPGDHFGNCTWCWKKSLRNHLTLAKDFPEVFDFPRAMEAEFGTHKAESVAALDGRRHFFRKHMSVDDIFARAQQPFVPYRDKREQLSLIPLYDPDLDIGSGCGESCEVFTGEAA